MTTNLSKKLLTAAVAAFALGTASLALTTDASARVGFGFRAFHGPVAHYNHGWYRGFGMRHVVWPSYGYGYGVRHYAWPHYGFGFARLGCWRMTPVGRINVCIP